MSQYKAAYARLALILVVCIPLSCMVHVLGFIVAMGAVFMDWLIQLGERWVEWVYPNKPHESTEGQHTEFSNIPLTVFSIEHAREISAQAGGGNSPEPNDLPVVY